MKNFYAKVALLVLLFICNNTFAINGHGLSPRYKAVTEAHILCTPGDVSIVSSATRICQGAVFSMTASGALTYTWSTSATTPVITLNPSITTIYTLTGTDQLGCISSATFGLLVDNLPTTSNAGASQAVCVIAGSVAINANVPAVGIGTWSVLSGVGTISNIYTPASVVSNFQPGLLVLAWGITNGVCPVSITTMSLLVNNVPMAIAGLNQTLCISSNAATMTAVQPPFGTGTWSVLSGAGVISSINSPSSSTSGFLPGLNVLSWNVANGSCSAVATVSIYVDEMPTPALSSPSQSVCGSTATLIGNTPIIGTGLWSFVVSNATIIVPNSSTTTVNNLDEGVNTFQWEISNGVCPVSVSTVSILSYVLPSAANAGTSQTICISNPSVSLMANTPFVGIGSWTIVSGIGIIASVNLPTTLVTGIGSGLNVFKWTITNGVCPPSVSQLSVTVNNLPGLSSAGPSQTVCGTTTSLNATSVTPGIGTWQVVSGTVTIASIGSPTTVVTNIATGSNILQWTITNGVCAPSISTVTLTGGVTPLLLATSSASVSCAGQNVTLTAMGASTYSWNTGATTPIINVSPTVTSTYTLTGSNNPCLSRITITQSVSVCTGLDPLNQVIQEPHIYPNPFNEEIHIEVNEVVSITIFNSLGQQLNFKLSNDRTTITTNDWDKGLYYVSLKSGNWNKNFRIIKD